MQDRLSECLICKELFIPFASHNVKKTDEVGFACFICCMARADTMLQSLVDESMSEHRPTYRSLLSLVINITRTGFPLGRLVRRDEEE